MAAHVLTALKQVADGERISNLQAALRINSWTDDLDLRQWQELDEICNGPCFPDNGTQREYNAAAWATALVPQFTEEWERLGKPETREDWRREKYRKEYRSTVDHFLE
jgi:hypothetical protein